MNHTNGAELFALGAGGGLALELLRLAESYGKLSKASFERQLGSSALWIVTAIFTLIAGFVAWVALADRETVSLWEAVATGIASRSLLRGTAAAKAAQGAKLGGTSRSRDIEVRRSGRVTFRELLE